MSRARMNEGAVADLYQRHAPAILAHCRRLLGSQAAARDATHEAFVRVLARAPGGLPADEALRYLYRVATNHCLNQLRERRVHERVADALRATTSPATPVGDHQADRDFASAVLARTDDTGAAIAVMHHVDGLSQVEIAATLGVTRRTVFNRLRKLKELAEQLLRPAAREPMDGAAGAPTDGAAEVGRPGGSETRSSAGEELG